MKCKIIKRCGAYTADAHTSKKMLKSASTIYSTRSVRRLTSTFPLTQDSAGPPTASDLTWRAPEESGWNTMPTPAGLRNAPCGVGLYARLVCSRYESGVLPLPGSPHAQAASNTSIAAARRLESSRNREKRSENVLTVLQLSGSRMRAKAAWPEAKEQEEESDTFSPTKSFESNEQELPGVEFENYSPRKDLKDARVKTARKKERDRE